MKDWQFFSILTGMGILIGTNIVIAIWLSTIAMLVQDVLLVM